MSNVIAVTLGGGLANGVTIGGLILAGIVLIAGTVVCQIAGSNRDKDRLSKGESISEEGSEKITGKTILSLIIIPVCFSSFYYISSSVGLRTSLNPDGYSSLTVMGILSIGACVGTNLFTLIYFGRRHELARLKFKDGHEARKICLLAIVAACCHFGGNIIHAIAVPVVSVVIATALGNSYNLWSYVWGLLYGEFKGSSKKTYATLVCGIALFALSSVILTIMGTRG